MKFGSVLNFCANSLMYMVFALDTPQLKYLRSFICKAFSGVINVPGIRPFKRSKIVLAVGPDNC